MNQMLRAYREKERVRVEKLFKAKKYKPGFPNKSALSEWYTNKLVEQEFKCCYCETSIFDICKLIDTNLLLTRRTGYGRRGPILEIDKIINDTGYSPENCALSCYYCNNDKSYTLEGNTYKKFFGESRNKFFRHLLAQDQLND